MKAAGPVGRGVARGGDGGPRHHVGVREATEDGGRPGGFGTERAHPEVEGGDNGGDCNTVGSSGGSDHNNGQTTNKSMGRKINESIKNPPPTPNNPDKIPTTKLRVNIRGKLT